MPEIAMITWQETRRHNRHSLVCFFDLAEIRQAINEEHTRIRWTATENMLVDCMTKQLDSEFFMKILRKGQWSINPRTKKAPKQQPQKQQLNRRPDAVVGDAPVDRASGGQRSTAGG